MKTKTIDLRELDKTELLHALKTLPVEEWNKAYSLAREESDYSWVANLDGAKLDGARLIEANLIGANLIGANLDGANLDRANLHRANLNRANLHEANLHRANLHEATLIGAKLNEANLHGANLHRATLDRAKLDGARLIEANLIGANLDGANLIEATLNGEYAWIGEAAGYSVLMLGADNKAGHIIRAGCYTGTLDGVVERALEEDGSERTRVEAGLVVAHGEGLLAEWNREGKDNQ